MITFIFNNAASYAILALEKVSPSLGDFKETIKIDFERMITPVRESDQVSTKEISTLIFHAIQPIQYLFWSTMMLTCGSYLAAKYTPIFRSIFKVTTLVSAIFTFEFFMFYVQIYKEYFYFEARSKERIKEIPWDDFLVRVEDFSRNILASTFFVSGKRFLADDINGGLLNLMKQGKDKRSPLDMEEVVQYLPGLTKWFRIEE